MISDIVLTKALPDAIKSSIEAYIGCISGAIMRRDYLGALEAAGFREVEVVDETSFPIDCLAGDPTAKAITESLRLTPEAVKKLANSIVSIKVHGVKPK